MSDGMHSFRPGDRVFVYGGYDGDESDWLRGGPGYRGAIVAMTADKASILLDSELVLEAPNGQSYQDFGEGSASAMGEVQTARGRWLTVMQGWVGGEWVGDRVMPLQVGLCPKLPDLYAIPGGGGIGYWVESHAEMARADQP